MIVLKEKGSFEAVSFLQGRDWILVHSQLWKQLEQIKVIYSVDQCKLNS